MLRTPAKTGIHQIKPWVRLKSSSSFIRSSFIEYFVEKHCHKHVKSSPVVPLYDSTVPFVNAGMNQFKGVFLGTVTPPSSRAVNSQKCVRVGGKHNDLDVVGTDGHHHTFFEMLGNWSFGDYYKKEACEMAWDLLLGPYRLKPDNLMVTYFAGDAVMGLQEDKECKEIWKAIGVPESRIKGLFAKDNFWEMGVSGPCGPCTEIHYINPDGSLTEIWNIVFIQCNRESDGTVKPLRFHHVDTGMGLERMAAILQGVPSNYDTDLFRPIIAAIEKNSKVSPYTGSYGQDSNLDAAYRRLADHARMISVCLADGVFPATSLNLKQIIRKSFKISTEVFQNPKLLNILYNQVVETLGSTYPELEKNEAQVKLVLDHEEQAYANMKVTLAKQWKDLAKQYPEVEGLADVEMAGFALGYKEFKETMAKQKSNTIPGSLVFKLYDTHGFQEDIIQRIADLNKLDIDKPGFWKLLSKHKTRHKTAHKEQANNKQKLFNTAIQNLKKRGYDSTNDSYKYEYTYNNNNVEFKTLKTEIIGILNEDITWIDFLEPCEDRTYYIITKDTNFYCEEGGQKADEGIIYVNDNIAFSVESVFKIQNFVFHKGCFTIGDKNSCLKEGSKVVLEVDDERRLKLMNNHTAVHLLNAAVRKVLSNSVVCAIGSSLSEKGLSLSLAVYGEKLSQDAVMRIQDLVRQSIKHNVPVSTRVVDSVQLSKESSVVTIPGETYPEVGLRLVTVDAPLVSKELCCGTHAPSTGLLQELCVTLVKGANSHTPTIHALTGEYAKQAREWFCRAEKLNQVIDLVDPERKKEELYDIRRGLGLLVGAGGAPAGDYAACLALLGKMEKRQANSNDMALHAVAQSEVVEAISAAQGSGRRFVVHFLRCSYLMQEQGVRRVLTLEPRLPTLLLGCAGGVIVAGAAVPRDMVSETLTAERWLRCITSIFGASLVPAEPGAVPYTYAEMTATKVSLINCEELVQDAMRVAIKYAQSHTKQTTEDSHTQDRQHN